MNISLKDREPCTWAPPDSVPICLLENLQTIGIKWFAGFKDELEAVEYLLTNARVSVH